MGRLLQENEREATEVTEATPDVAVDGVQPIVEEAAEAGQPEEAGEPTSTGEGQPDPGAVSKQ